MIVVRPRHNACKIVSPPPFSPPYHPRVQAPTIGALAVATLVLLGLLCVGGTALVCAGSVVGLMVLGQSSGARRGLQTGVPPETVEIVVASASLGATATSLLLPNTPHSPRSPRSSPSSVASPRHSPLRSPRRRASLVVAIAPIPDPVAAASLNPVVTEHRV